MKKYSVIVAGGTGSRMNSSVPKQFLQINNKPLLFYTIDVFLKAFDDINIILVLPKEFLSMGEEIKKFFFPDCQIQICSGGETRFNSVQNGLSMINEESIVFIHDGVRCLLSKELIHRCYDAAIQYGSAIPVIPSKDSIRMVTYSGNKVVDRKNIRLVQTPQTFKSDILLPSFKTSFNEKFTDEATVVEESGHKIHLVEGEENNIKITTPIDLVFAEKILPVV